MGRDDIGKLFTTVKREGKVILKVGRALGGGKRASKIPIDGMWCAFLVYKQQQTGSEILRSQPLCWAAIFGQFDRPK